MGDGSSSFTFWVGNDTIDGSNGRLIDFYTLSADQLDAEVDPDARYRIVDRVIRYTFNHFDAEEKHMNLHDYPSLVQHQEDHLLFSCLMVRLYKHFREGYALREMLVYLTKEFHKHIFIFDLPYSTYLLKKSETGHEKSNHSR